MERPKLLVLLVLEKLHSDFASLATHVLFSLEDSNGHRGDGHRESWCLVVVAGHLLGVDAVVSEANVSGWQETVEEFVIAHGTVHVGVELGDDVVAFLEGSVFHVVFGKELLELLGSNVAIS